MRRLALVASHFPPSNLPSVHRPRLWAEHLEEFGWRPTVVTTHWRHYREAVDPELAERVDPGLAVVHTGALPVPAFSPIRDLGLRSLPWHYRALARLAAGGEIDFTLVTIPSNYCALLGRWLKRRHGVPYGIDYQDPWVHDWPGSDRPLSKAWMAASLARRLEPWAVGEASLITGVAPLYLSGVLRRHPRLRRRAVIATMPVGGSARDFAAALERGVAPYLFDPGDGLFHLAYAGAAWPDALPVLRRLLEGLAALATGQPQIARRVRLHFIGTGGGARGTRPTVLPLARELGVGALVCEHPERVPHGDVLRHLTAAGAVVLFGSQQRHYTPSKLFETVLSRRPLLALLHRESAAVDLLRRLPHAAVLAFGSDGLPSAARVCEAIGGLARSSSDHPLPVDDALVEELSARHGARRLAEALDRAIAAAPGSGAHRRAARRTSAAHGELRER